MPPYIKWNDLTMKKDITWGLLPEVLSGVSMNSDSGKYPHLLIMKAFAISIFQYLSGRQKQSGAIFDANVINA